PNPLPEYREREQTGPPPRADLVHVARCQTLIALLPLLVLVAHSLLYWLGKMASNGELRYLMVVTPFWALLAAKGWERIFETFKWKRVYAWAGVAALLPATINFAYYQVLPLTLTEDWQRARKVAEWYRTSELRKDYPYLCAAHPGIFYFLDISPTGPQAKEWHLKTIENPPPGTLLVWDSVYGVYNADEKRSVQLHFLFPSSWIPAAEHREVPLNFGMMSDGNIWRTMLSPKTINGTDTERLDLEEQIR
ncbi:MAG: hypothetical protein ACREIT_04385, partial [Tepidisphaeraceae bacterium]